MKRFQFGPEKVRVWREKQAEVEEVKLQRLHSELQRVVLQQQSLQAEAQAADQAVRERPQMDSQDLAHLDSFKQYVRARFLKLTAEQRQWEAKIVQQRQLWVEARRAAELLNQLKADRLVEWRASHDKEQENLSTELFLAKRKRGRT